MAKTRVVPTKEHQLKSYVFKVVLEQDEWLDKPASKAVWRAYVPVLEEKGAASWGNTPKEALESLKDALGMVVEHMVEVGEAIPEEPSSLVQTSSEPLISVTA